MYVFVKNNKFKVYTQFFIRTNIRITLNNFEFDKRYRCIGEVMIYSYIQSLNVQLKTLT
jgi:hypothetical protein